MSTNQKVSVTVERIFINNHEIGKYINRFSETLTCACKLMSCNNGGYRNEELSSGRKISLKNCEIPSTFLKLVITI